MGEHLLVRGIRGAISVEGNTSRELIDATKELLITLVKENDLNTEDIASIFFTVTPDLNADFPASAARELGWTYVPLLCAREIDVPDGPPKLIRVLVHANTAKSQQEISHVYLKDAANLRPDLRK